MARYPLGQPVTIPITVRQRNADGSLSLVDAATVTTVVQVRNADGTSTVTGTYASPAHDGTGLYHQDIPAADLALTDHYQWTVTTTGPGAGVAFGDFDVFDPFEPSVLPLADGKDALNIPQSDTSNDAEISQYIATITQSLERMTGGPLVNRTITSERCELDGTNTVLVVRQRPLVSVTSIVSVASGLPIDISAGLDIDPNACTIRRKLGYPFYGPYFVWLPAMYVTYVAGWGTAVPAAFNTFARIVLQHLWSSQHGPSARPSMAGETATVTPPGWGFAIPNQAAELLNGGQDGMPFLQEAYV